MSAKSKSFAALSLVALLIAAAFCWADASNWALFLAMSFVFGILSEVSYE